LRHPPQRPWHCGRPSAHTPPQQPSREQTINATSEPASRPRFLKLTQLAELLNVSEAQAYALVRSGSIPAIKVGGRGQWRIEASAAEEAIQKMYADTAQFIQDHPFGATTDVDDTEID